MIYAPTNEAEEMVKGQFYELLQREVKNTPRHDMMILMGNTNAKGGEDNIGWERVMTRQGR